MYIEAGTILFAIGLIAILYGFEEYLQRKTNIDHTVIKIITIVIGMIFAYGVIAIFYS